MINFSDFAPYIIGDVTDGMLLVDKPAGISSFRMVSWVRGAIQRELGRKVKVGHTGTLDPFATGLLILMLEKGTKRCQDFLKLDKWYEAELILGVSSTTGDPEGELQYLGGRAVTAEEVQTAMRALTGKIWQTVPKFSAVKIQGQRAYELARQGKEVELPRRQVAIYALELISLEDIPGNKANSKLQLIKFRCHVSSGTYIRTLGEDLAKKLGTVGYLRSLRRLKIGEYDLKQAYSLTLSHDN